MENFNFKSCEYSTSERNKISHRSRKRKKMNMSFEKQNKLEKLHLTKSTLRNSTPNSNAVPTNNKFKRHYRKRVHSTPQGKFKRYIKRLKKNKFQLLDPIISR